MTEPTFFEILRSWSWQPVILLGLAAAAVSYAYGFHYFRQHGWLEGMYQRGLIRRSQPWLFGGGLLAIFIALLSPIDILSELLFSFHMAQHILLVMVAPPLLLLGLPAPFLRWSLVEARVRGILNAITDPVVAFALYNVNLWLWHIPALYQAALRNELLHDLQHALFFYTAVLFWWRVLDPTHGWFPLWGWPPAKWIYLMVAAPPSYILGSIFWASSAVYYPYYAEVVPRLWGLTALRDQQIAGLIMWLHSWMYLMASMIALYIRYEPEKEQV